jgi:RNA polymerase sigma-70 factor (ECF subfamily)
MLTSDPGTTNPALLERLRQPKERQSWHDFAKLYMPFLNELARRMLPQHAEDLAQDVFLIFLQRAPTFIYDETKSFRGYLKKVLISRMKEYPKPLVPIVVEPPVPDIDDTEEDLRELLKRALKNIQNDFKPTTWKCFWECHINGRTAKDVAQELGLTVGAVWMNCCRVMRRLRDEVARLREEESAILVRLLSQLR